MALSDAARRAAWLTMPVAETERDRWRSVPVAEIEALQREMAALRARIAERENAKASRKATRRKARRKHKQSKAP